MARRIPGKVLPHRNLVNILPYLGGGAEGRQFGAPITIKRALIIDETELIRDQYDAEVVSTSTVFFERSELAQIPEPETKATIWINTSDERETVVVRASRYQHPRVGDIVEVKLR